MKIKEKFFEDLFLLEPDKFQDKRGFFFESYNKKILDQILQDNINFVQDNHSHSVKGTLRGLHYQSKNQQDKLIRVIKGKIFDVAVDIRKSSKYYGKWKGIELSEENSYQFWIPKGFAHGFYVMSDVAEVIYKTTDYYNPLYEISIKWDDKNLDIDWPIKDKDAVFLSKKDRSAKSFISL